MPPGFHRDMPLPFGTCGLMRPPKSMALLCPAAAAGHMERTQ